MGVKLKGTLPGDNTNGLGTDEVLKHFTATPKQMLLVVALVSAETGETNYDTGDHVPRLRLRHVEVVPGDQRGIAAEILAQAHAERTGALMLPFEVDSEFTIPDDAGDGEPGEEPDA